MSTGADERSAAELDPRPGRWTAVAGSRERVVAFVGVLVVLVGVAVLVGRLGGWVGRPVSTGGERPPAVPTPTPPSVSRPSAEVETSLPEAPTEVAGWFWILLASVVAVLLYLLLRRVWDTRRRIREGRRGEPEPLPSTGPAFDEEPPPQIPLTPPGRQFDARAAADAIVSCWVWVEDWAAARGRPRLSFETPTEFLDRVAGAPAPAPHPTEGAAELSAAAQREEAARILLPLYQRARFDVAALDPESAVRARDAALVLCGKDAVDVP